MSDGPYVGPYPLTNARLFFGRKREVADLRDQLVGRRLVLLHSPSGAGKTSLIQAGLLPFLEKQRLFTMRPVARVNKNPELSQDVEANRYVLSTLLSWDEGRPAEQQTSLTELAVMTLNQYLSNVAPPGEQSRELLIFDQFEEVLTLDPTDAAAKQAFFEQLGEALREPPRWALFAIRQDHVAALDSYLSLLPYKVQERFALDFLSVDAAIDAMHGPAWAYEPRVDFTLGAAGQLAKDLCKVYVQDATGKMMAPEGSYVEPVHLQVVCKRLWETRAHPDRIDEADVTGIGNVDQALADYYASSVASVAKTTGVAERAIRDWFERKLITPQKLRGQVMLEEGRSQGLENGAIDLLVEAYLVRKETRRGITWFELAHDRLIDPVRGENARWRQRHPSLLQDQAQLWFDQGQPRRLLLSSTALATEERRIQAEGIELGDGEKQFLQESRDLLRENARRATLRTNLADLGWGVIFAADADLATRDALAELLSYRRNQANERNPNYYKEFSGQSGCLPGKPDRPAESAQEFLARHGAGAALATPDRVPYYLLIVGDPETIPFEFQYQLDLQYAVGRIYFDTLDEYRRYAHNVVAAETAGAAPARTLTIFAPQHPDDPVTETFLETLVGPLLDRLRQNEEWSVKSVLGPEASKQGLRRVLGGPDTPALLFTAGHGASFSLDHRKRQQNDNGALVCGEWSGPEEAPPPFDPTVYFAASDVPDDAQLKGLIAFFLAGYGAGTPRRAGYALRYGWQQASLYADRAFLARLPLRLLAHHAGGPLAVIGHVDRLWGARAEQAGSEHDSFVGVLQRLMEGHTVGSAMEVMNHRYAQLTSRIAERSWQRSLQYEERPNQRPSQAGEELEAVDVEGEELLKTTVDTRNYIVLGDPAVRLPS